MDTEKLMAAINEVRSSLDNLEAMVAGDIGEEEMGDTSEDGVGMEDVPEPPAAKPGKISIQKRGDFRKALGI